MQGAGRGGGCGFTRRVREKKCERAGVVGVDGVPVGGVASQETRGGWWGARVIAVCSDCIMQSSQSAGERGCRKEETGRGCSMARSMGSKP